MLSLIFGLIILIVTFGLSFSTSNINHYFQSHSLALVGLGTLALLFLIFPSQVVKGLVKSLARLFKPDEKLQDFQTEIQKLSRDKNQNIQTQNLLIKYAHQLWEQGVSADLFIVLISEKKNELESKSIDVIHSLKNLAKYPPALGMVGTVMGMIDLFINLEKNQNQIGASLSVAMTATLLGLLISNFFISPLADRLHVIHMKDQRLNTGIYELLLLINSNQPLSLIEEEFKSRGA